MATLPWPPKLKPSSGAVDVPAAVDAIHGAARRVSVKVTNAGFCALTCALAASTGSKRLIGGVAVERLVRHALRASRRAWRPTGSGSRKAQACAELAACLVEPEVATRLARRRHGRRGCREKKCRRGQPCRRIHARLRGAYRPPVRLAQELGRVPHQRTSVRAKKNRRPGIEARPAVVCRARATRGAYRNR